ncbi:hypothetical protein EPYR_02001 [Erwinia pyrifoliae DSM 12163]|nr:hypothetical protein EPYR_02001 [Erwinia pyrifoliae DSM 12163]
MRANVAIKMAMNIGKGQLGIDHFGTLGGYQSKCRAL